LTGTGSAVVQYVYAGDLKNPSRMPPGVMQTLAHYGITAQDFPDILKRDPFAAPVRPIRPVPATPHAAAAPPAPDPARFKPLNLTFPYEPPYSATDPVPTLNTTVSNADTATTTSAATDDFKVGVTNSVDLAAPVKASLKSDASWDWTNTATASATNRTAETASVTVGGPAFGYTGPTAMEVYYDTIYKTFLFRPLEFPTIAFQGRLLSKGNKQPMAWKEVVLIANGTKYRTFTNARGQYRFYGAINGPLKLQAALDTKVLPQIPHERVIDFELSR
jgi:hypothetical protein